MMGRSANHVNRFHTGREGSALVEFAVSVLLVLTIIFSMIEFGSSVYTYVVLADAVNEGVRYAIVHSSDSAGAQAKVTAYVANTLHDMSSLTVNVTYPDDNSKAPPSRVRITASYPYVPYLSAFMSNPPTMHAYAEGRLVN
jgi:Flp pilus assembly protein TadG